MSTDKLAAAIREFAYKHAEPKVTRNSYGEPDISPDVNKINAMLSDLTALISEGYYPKEKYNELLQQRDELKVALISLMWQFAYYGTKNNVAVMHTGGLSALEDAFSALGLSDPITVENFEAAIKNTER